MKTGAVFGYFQFSSTMPNYGRVWAERQSTNFDRSRGKVEMEKYMHLWAKESRLVQIREGFQNESWAQKGWRCSRKREQHVQRPWESWAAEGWWASQRGKPMSQFQEFLQRISSLAGLGCCHWKLLKLRGKCSFWTWGLFFMLWFSHLMFLRKIVIVLHGHMLIKDLGIVKPQTTEALPHLKA